MKHLFLPAMILTLSLGAQAQALPKVGTLKVKITDHQGRFTEPHGIHFSRYQSTIFFPGSWSSHNHCTLEIKNLSEATCTIKNFDFKAIKSIDHNAFKVSISKIKRTYDLKIDNLCFHYPGRGEFFARPEDFKVTKKILAADYVDLEIRDCEIVKP